MVDRGLGVSLVPDWARPWPEGLRLARIALPTPFEPRRIGVLWTRSTIRIRLVKAFLQEAGCFVEQASAAVNCIQEPARSVPTRDLGN